VVAAGQFSSRGNTGGKTAPGARCGPFARYRGAVEEGQLRAVVVERACCATVGRAAWRKSAGGQREAPGDLALEDAGLVGERCQPDLLRPARRQEASSARAVGGGRDGHVRRALRARSAEPQGRGRALTPSAQS
jgi:hypothetical protein